MRKITGIGQISLEEWILSLKGVGVDAISVDPVGSSTFVIHKIFLQKNILIIENLTNLERLPQTCLFTCLPLKIKDADGSPVRAAGIVL